ncbi:iron(III) transport system substrate-binding protein [Litorimonas taeanensis]|uniref:Iron(III) transport system substrate-binding protein n=1 Tax=Litorimonas taeanensis TaxID=568099 RepID=A0A420WKA4_9PROT|nr:Fe(3+) ABC transporter substrate-binding protein [Litorimonas taeanensis]RKQ71379.1 iron(III) transport system substrate-binding protein [Litorimonas taeanensis]
MDIRSKLNVTLTTLLAAALAACSPADKSHDGEGTATVVKSGEVNLYSSRHYDTDLALYNDFTEQTGIKVNRIEASSDSLIERIKSEGEFSPADLLITVDAGVFWRAENAGVLSSTDSDVLNARIPESLRHPDGLWYGISKRARVIIFNKGKGKPEGLESYEDLAKPAFKGRVCMRSSGNIYNISLLSSMVAHDGLDAAKAWAQGVVNNFQRKPQSNDSGQIEAVAAGICDISMVNTYYLARYARSDEAQNQEIFNNIGIIFPNQNDRGTHVNISGAGVTTHAPNRENAIKFLEYLTSESAQGYFANGNNEYPVITDSITSSAVETLGTFKEDTLNVSQLGQNQADAVRIYDAVGWQ